MNTPRAAVPSPRIAPVPAVQGHPIRRVPIAHAQG